MRFKSASAQRVLRLVPAILAVAALATAGCSAVEKGVDKGVQAAKDHNKSDTARAKVGDCINVITASAVDSETEPVACTSDKAVYKVAQVRDQKVECAADYTSYEETMNGRTLAYLCLAPNFTEGKCYAESPLSGYKFAECGSSDASFRVAQRIDGQSDENLCGEEADSVITLAEPPTTFCLAPVKS
ncbi:hypothetical protein NONO_c45340 [Nocardia nova SH22a]|uniref:Lipoprotein n=1 Tax=Nocardia nova SH22a TaxID=1415166 RepID=W5TK34_9NOCA|nr:hypothetical protein [Nocardia nova]AHH19318.1 hypothetical protein NONO_c45340 [Nocardia nova SH22a]